MNSSIAIEVVGGYTGQQLSIKLHATPGDKTEINTRSILACVLSTLFVTGPYMDFSIFCLDNYGPERFLLRFLIDRTLSFSIFIFLRLYSIQRFEVSDGLMITHFGLLLKETNCSSTIIVENKTKQNI